MISAWPWLIHYQQCKMELAKLNAQSMESVNEQETPLSSALAAERRHQLHRGEVPTLLFEQETGFEIPTEPDTDDEAFREFLLFRHRVLAEYLGDLAETAWNAGIVPFWESSTNDTPEGRGQNRRVDLLLKVKAR